MSEDTPPISLEKSEVIFTTTTPKRRTKKEIDPETLPELKEWDPRSLPEGFFMVLEGKRRTGKSTFVKWLLQWYQNEFSLVWVMTHTKASGYYQSIVGSDFVFDHWTPVAIQRLIERNKKVIEVHGEDSPTTKKACSALIILDDCISQEIWSSEDFINLAVAGRHYKISVIFVTQDPKTVCPKVRDNADVAIVFNQKTFRNKESIWHDFMNDVDKPTALALLAKHAIHHNALVCVQTNLDGVIQKNFFKSEGDKTKLQRPNYSLGGPSQKEIIARERAIEKEKKKSKERESTPIDEASTSARSFTVERVESFSGGR